MTLCTSNASYANFLIHLFFSFTMGSAPSKTTAPAKQAPAKSAEQAKTEAPSSTLKLAESYLYLVQVLNAFNEPQADGQLSPISKANKTIKSFNKNFRHHIEELSKGFETVQHQSKAQPDTSEEELVREVCQDFYDKSGSLLETQFERLAYAIDMLNVLRQRMESVREQVNASPKIKRKLAGLMANADAIQDAALRDVIKNLNLELTKLEALSNKLNKLTARENEFKQLVEGAKSKVKFRVNTLCKNRGDEVNAQRFIERLEQYSIEKMIAANRRHTDSQSKGN